MTHNQNNHLNVIEGGTDNNENESFDRREYLIRDRKIYDISHSDQEYLDVFDEFYAENACAYDTISKHINHIQRAAVLDTRGGQKVSAADLVEGLIERGLPVIRVLDINDDLHDEYFLGEHARNATGWLFTTEAGWSRISDNASSIATYLGMHQEDKSYMRIENEFISHNRSIPTINIGSINNSKLNSNKLEDDIICKNIVFNPKTKEANHIEPSHFAGIQMKRYYDVEDYSEVEAEIFDRMYADFAGNDNEQKLLLMQIHYAVLLHYNAGIQAINIIGEAGSGKSTFGKILSSLYGEKREGGHVTLSYTDMSKNDDKKLAKISRDSLILDMDADHNVYVSNVALFKKLTSGDPIAVNKVYRDAETIIFNGMIVQIMNDMPRFKNNNSKALRDRMVFAQLSGKTFRSTDDEDGKFHEKIIQKIGTGRLAKWLIDNVEPFSSFNVTKSAEELLNDFSTNDSSGQFIKSLEEAGLLNSNALSLNTLFKTYKANYKANNGTEKGCFGSKTFNKVITEYLSSKGYRECNKNLKRAKTLRNKNVYDDLMIRELYLSAVEVDDYLFNESEDKTESSMHRILENQANNITENEFIERVNEVLRQDDEDQKQIKKVELLQIYINKFYKRKDIEHQYGNRTDIPEKNEIIQKAMDGLDIEDNDLRFLKSTLE